MMPDVRITRNNHLDRNTPQSAGILRLAAINSDLSSSSHICGGIMIAQPRTASSVHHHGEQETIIYVLGGSGQVRWGRHGECSETVRPGDFVFIPAHLPHQELNPTAETVTWVVIRSGPQPLVVNLPGFDPIASTSAR
jgi:uncharacterized RmlC-like cupin family protein